MTSPSYWSLFGPEMPSVEKTAYLHGIYYTLFVYIFACPTIVRMYHVAAKCTVDPTTKHFDTAARKDRLNRMSFLFYACSSAFGVVGMILRHVVERVPDISSSTKSNSQILQETGMELSKSFFTPNGLISYAFSHFKKTNEISLLVTFIVFSVMTCVVFSNNFELYFKLEFALVLKVNLSCRNATFMKIFTSTGASRISSVVLKFLRVLPTTVCYVIVAKMWNCDSKIPLGVADHEQWSYVWSGTLLDYIVLRFFIAFMTPMVTILNPVNAVFGWFKHFSNPDNSRLHKFLTVLVTLPTFPLLVKRLM